MGGYFQIDSSGYANSFIMAYNGDRWCLIRFGISIFRWKNVVHCCTILYKEKSKKVSGCPEQNAQKLRQLLNVYTSFQ